MNSPSNPLGPGLLSIPLGQDASPCDLLHDTPLPRLDARAAAEALTFAFASGDGDILFRLVDHSPVAPSLFVANDFAPDLLLEQFAETCMPVYALGQRREFSHRYLYKLISSPPSDRAHVEHRQAICAELVSSPALCERLEQLYVSLCSFRNRLRRPSVGHQDSIDRRLSILSALRSVGTALGRDFEGTTSGLSRLSNFGAHLSAGSGFHRMCELLDYEENRAEVDLRLRIGFDGRIRSFQTLERRENRSSAFHATLLGRAWTSIKLFVGGYQIGRSEVLSRLLDSIFSNLDGQVVYLFQLIGDIEIYLATLGMRRLAAQAGLSMSLPELRDDGPRRLDSLFNPWLACRGTPCTPCDIRAADGQHLGFITGPNSGGKTRLLQSLALTQLLGQSGLFVPASTAVLRWTNGLFASLIEHATADQVEGRLGTELMRIRRLFERSQLGGMVLLDELCSGTNPSEGEALIQLVLRSLQQLHPQAFVTTHFLEFAARLKETNSQGLFLQAALDEYERPTYQFAEGVAKTSLAHRVAERLGVTPQSLDELVHLAKRAHASRPSPSRA